MSHYPCHRDVCEKTIEETEEEDTTGRLAYCSNECFEIECRSMSETFNSLHSLNFSYTIGNPESEAQLLALLKQKNPYIAHSFEMDDNDEYPGGWHWFWVPSLDELKSIADENGVGLDEVEFDEWDDFMCQCHPVKGIALLHTFEALGGLSVSYSLRPDGTVAMDAEPSEPDFQIQRNDVTKEMSIREVFESLTMNSIREYMNNNRAHSHVFRHHFGATNIKYTCSIVLLGCTEASTPLNNQYDQTVSVKTAIENSMTMHYEIVFTIVEGNTSAVLNALESKDSAKMWNGCQMVMEWFEDDMSDRLSEYVSQNFASTNFEDIWENFIIEYGRRTFKLIVEEQVFDSLLHGLPKDHPLLLKNLIE